MAARLREVTVLVTTEMDSTELAAAGGGTVEDQVTIIREVVVAHRG